MYTGRLLKGYVGSGFKGINMPFLIFSIFPKTHLPEKAVEVVLLPCLPFLSPVTPSKKNVPLPVFHLVM